MSPPSSAFGRISPSEILDLRHVITAMSGEVAPCAIESNKANMKEVNWRGASPSPSRVSGLRSRGGGIAHVSGVALLLGGCSFQLLLSNLDYFIAILRAIELGRIRPWLA